MVWPCLHTPRGRELTKCCFETCSAEDEVRRGETATSKGRELIFILALEQESRVLNQKNMSPPELTTV